MRNITGQAVVGDDLFGRTYELERLWEKLEQGEHILMLAPRRVGKTSLMQELDRVPREKWDVFYADVQGGEGPADCIAAILASLATDHRYRSYFDAVPFSSAIKNVLGGLSSLNVNIDVLRVELKRAIGREWDHAADQLQARLTSAPDAGNKLLIIVDELPILIARMLQQPERKRDTELLLSRLRQWRQAPEMRGRVHTLVGGSVGLEGILRRAGLSGLVNGATCKTPRDGVGQQEHKTGTQRPVTRYPELGECRIKDACASDSPCVSTSGHFCPLAADEASGCSKVGANKPNQSCRGSSRRINWLTVSARMPNMRWQNTFAWPRTRT